MTDETFGRVVEYYTLSGRAVTFVKNNHTNYSRSSLHRPESRIEIL